MHQDDRTGTCSVWGLCRLSPLFMRGKAGARHLSVGLSVIMGGGSGYLQSQWGSKPPVSLLPMASTDTDLFTAGWHSPPVAGEPVVLC